MGKSKRLSDAEILDIWLANTTCSRRHIRRTVLLTSPTHVVLRHYAHSEYMGVFAKKENCESAACLYFRAGFGMDRNVGISLSAIGGHIRKWTGRLNSKSILADCESMGIKGLAEAKNADRLKFRR